MKNKTIMRKIALLFRGIRRIWRNLFYYITLCRVKWVLFLNQVKYGKRLHCNGIPYICVSPFEGSLVVGDDLTLNNGIRFNPIGFPQPCTLYVDANATLVIGDRVGISQASIICHHNIKIGNDVKIGGGVKIYDTDFHSLNPKDRLDRNLDISNKKKEGVIIGNNVLIGAGAFILKGVTIGDNSIIGAGSVVTKSIPSNQIWGGNPAELIRKI